MEMRMPAANMVLQQEGLDKQTSTIVQNFNNNILI